MLYGCDEGKPFYTEIQIEIQGLSVARSASDYFHSVQIILPPFWEYLSLYCSANLISDFPGSRERWSVLFVMLKGTWAAFQPKGLFKGSDTTNTLFAAEQANSHCYLKLRVKYLKSPKILTWEKQPSPSFLHMFCFYLWVRTVFWSVSSRARQSFVWKKLSVLSDINPTFLTAIYWFTCSDRSDSKWWMLNGEHSTTGQGDCKIFDVSKRSNCLGTSLPLPLYLFFLPSLVVYVMGVSVWALTMDLAALIVVQLLQLWAWMPVE